MFSRLNTKGTIWRLLNGSLVGAARGIFEGRLAIPAEPSRSLDDNLVAT